MSNSLTFEIFDIILRNFGEISKNRAILVNFTASIVIFLTACFSSEQLLLFAFTEHRVNDVFFLSECDDSGRDEDGNSLPATQDDSQDDNTSNPSKRRKKEVNKKVKCNIEA